MILIGIEPRKSISGIDGRCNQQGERKQHKDRGRKSHRMPRSSLDHFSKCCNGSKGVTFRYLCQGAGRVEGRSCAHRFAHGLIFEGLMLRASFLSSNHRGCQCAPEPNACLTVCREGCDDAERIAMPRMSWPCVPRMRLDCRPSKRRSAVSKLAVAEANDR